MQSSARITPASTHDPNVTPGAPASRLLLGCGIVAGPLYLTAGILQGLLRDGFSFARHPLSVLTNGPGGWVQIANLALNGALVIAAAAGFQRALGPKARAMSASLAVFGAGMLVAAVFRADPMDGFPVGTPLGPPTSISTSGIIHFAAGGIGFVSLAISCFCAARVLARRNARSLSRFSSGCGLIVLLGFFSVTIPNSSPVLGIWIAVVVGWAWLAILARHARRLGTGLHS
jgi:hypothetical protein